MGYLDKFRADDALWSFATARFSVEFHAGEESSSPSDSFEFQEDIDFASDGELAHWFSAVVLIRDVATDYVIGCDTLGGCSYNSLKEFVTGHRSADADNRNTLAMKARNTVICHYFPDMVRSAIADTRKFVRRYDGIKAA